MNETKVLSAASSSPVLDHLDGKLRRLLPPPLRAATEKEKLRRLSSHEAGHGVVAWSCGCDPSAMRLVRYGTERGATRHPLPCGPRQEWARMVIRFGGMAGEAVLLGEAKLALSVSDLNFALDSAEFDGIELPDSLRVMPWLEKLLGGSSVSRRRLLLMTLACREARRRASANRVVLARLTAVVRAREELSGRDLSKILRRA